MEYGVFISIYIYMYIYHLYLYILAWRHKDSNFWNNVSSSVPPLILSNYDLLLDVLTGMRESYPQSIFKVMAINT